MSEKQHTPTPWKLQSHTGGTDYDFLVVPGNLKQRKCSIALVVGKNSEAQANAKFILTACNSFDKLVEACKAMIGPLQMAADMLSTEDGSIHSILSEARAALAAAGAKE